MNCEHCGERPAEITLTEMGSESEMSTLHLCSSCAALKGLSVGMANDPPIADLLAHLGGPGEGAYAADAESCEYCGTRQRDFRRNGRLGCPQCYSRFGEQLRELLRRIHGSPQHLGKVYVSAGVNGDDMEARLATLRRRLERAVEVEDFESAAELRDEIHGLMESE